MATKTKITKQQLKKLCPKAAEAWDVGQGNDGGKVTFYQEGDKFLAHQSLEGGDYNFHFTWDGELWAS